MIDSLYWPPSVTCSKWMITDPYSPDFLLPWHDRTIEVWLGAKVGIGLSLKPYRCYVTFCSDEEAEWLIFEKYRKEFGLDWKGDELV